MLASMLRVVFLSLALFCAGGLAIPASGETADLHPAEFHGYWKGSHLDPKSGERRDWVAHRRADGRYTLYFKFFTESEFDSMDKVEGDWWIVHDYYFARGDDWGKGTLHAYFFQWLNPDFLKMTFLKGKYVMVDERTTDAEFKRFAEDFEDWVEEVKESMQDLLDQEMLPGGAKPQA